MSKVRLCIAVGMLVVGAGAVVVGAALIVPPLGLIAVGVLNILAALLLVDVGHKRS